MKNEIIYGAILTVYVVVGSYLYEMHKFFANSNFFVATVTFLVGSLAFYVYAKQKTDEKTNAATTVLLEIRNAEEKIDYIQEKINSGNTFDLPTVLPTNSWTRYSHLFVEDFDSDELKFINTFYSTCATLEELVHRQNNFVWVATEERARVAQRLLGEIHIEFQKEYLKDVAKAKKTFDDEKEAITKFYTDEGYFYAPTKSLEGLKFEIHRIQKVIATPCGAKLKALSR